MCELKRIRFHCGHEMEWYRICKDTISDHRPCEDAKYQPVPWQEAHCCCSRQCILREILSKETDEGVSIADRLANSNGIREQHQECPENSEYFIALKMDDESLDDGRWLRQYDEGIVQRGRRLNLNDVIRKLK